jgi:hypothetical protein
VDKRGNDGLTMTVFAIIAVILFAWYWHVNQSYPYYFMWDMDHITTLDTLLINSGMLPDQILHPSFGVYLFLFFSEKIAHFLGSISAVNLAEVAASLNPLAVMAELTDFIRFHSPFLLVGVVLLLCSAMRVIFDISRWWSIFFLVFLGVQESLIYHSSMIRSELYSIFYWCIAVLMAAVAARTNRPIKKIVSLLATGVFLWLCFLSKTQALFYLAAVAVLFLIFSFLGDSQENRHRNPAGRGAFWVLAASFFNITVFLALSLVSYSTPIPRGIPTWAKTFGFTPMVIIFSLALFFLFVCQLYLHLTNKISSTAFGFFSSFNIIGVGFILSFSLYFLLYANTEMSLQYMLLNFKMVFLRTPDSALLPSDISGFLIYLEYNPLLFIVHIALVAFLIFGYFSRFVQITKIQLVLCVLLSIIAFINIAVATRPNLRDILWKEVLLNFLNLFYFAIFINRVVRYRLVLTVTGCGLLVLLFFVNCAHSYNMPVRIDANYSQYGWRVDKFLGAVYGGNQRNYSELMQNRYNNTTGWVASYHAVNHRQIRRTVDFVFKNQAINLRNIGIAFNGFSAWVADLDYKITEVPPPLRAGILVDNSSIQLNRKTFFKKEYVQAPSEYIDKFKEPPTGENMSVLTRFDLKIFLFVEASDVSDMMSRDIIDTSYKIVLQNSEQSIDMHGLEIKN